MREAREILGFPVEGAALELREIQTTDLRELVAHKAEQAWALLERPVMVEDTALIFKAWGALPGVFIKHFLQQMGDQQFDIVFLDPPFATELRPDLCRLLQAGPMLADHARVYIEEDRARPAFELPEDWQVLKTRNAGNVRYSLVNAGTRPRG